jgi:hypothetical protein
LPRYDYGLAGLEAIAYYGKIILPLTRFDRTELER